MKNVINTQNITETVKLTSIFALVASPFADAPGTIAIYSIAYYAMMSLMQSLNLQSDISWAKAGKIFRKTDFEIILMLSDISEENKLTEDRKQAIKDEIEDLNKEIENTPKFFKIFQKSLRPLNGFKRSPV